MYIYYFYILDDGLNITLRHLWHIKNWKKNILNTNFFKRGERHIEDADRKDVIEEE